MGKRGPIGRSKELHEAMGNPGHRKKGEDHEVISAPPADVSCPTKLKGDAREFWERMAPLLVEKGLLTKLDVYTFELLCDYYSKWQKYQRLADQATIPESKWISHSLKYSQRFELLAERFGLGPTSRQRLKVPTEKKKSKGFDDILNGVSSPEADALMKGR